MSGDIPRLHDPAERRTETRAYQAGTLRFGAPHAAPDLVDAPELGRHHEDELIAAALAGVIDRAGLEQLCRMYRQLQGELAAERDAHHATTLDLEAAENEIEELQRQVEQTVVTGPSDQDLDAVVVDVVDLCDTVRIRRPVAAPVV